MKLLNKAIFIIFTALLITSALRKTYAQNRVLPEKISTIADYGKNLALLKSQIFVLTLKNQVDGGFRFNSPQYDRHILRLVKHLEKSPAQNGPLGAPGRDIWEFEALKTGKTGLKVTSARPWAQKNNVLVYSACLIIK